MDKKEYRQKLADMFVKSLEENGLSWSRGWEVSGAPRNGITNRVYHGTNEFCLSLIQMVNGYKDPRWVTFNQIGTGRRSTTPAKNGI